MVTFNRVLISLQNLNLIFQFFVEMKIEIICQVIWMIIGLMSLFQQIAMMNHTKIQLTFIIITVLGNSVSYKTLQGIGSSKFIIRSTKKGNRLS